MESPRFLPDSAISAGEDQLDFNRFVEPLGSLLASPETRTPITVGIFGPWGSGKSSMLQLLEGYLEKQFKGKFLAVEFMPWIHRREPNMLVPLLYVLHATTSRFGGSQSNLLLERYSMF